VTYLVDAISDGLRVVGYVPQVHDFQRYALVVGFHQRHVYRAKRAFAEHPVQHDPPVLGGLPTAVTLHNGDENIKKAEKRNTSAGGSRPKQTGGHDVGVRAHTHEFARGAFDSRERRATTILAENPK